MTRDEAVKIILGRCGNRIGNEFLRNQTILELKLKQETVLEQADFKPWFLLSEYQHAKCGLGENRLPLPELFLEEPEEGMLWVKTPGATQYVAMNRDDTDHLELKYSDYAPQLPLEYGIMKGYLILFPTPDLEYPVKMRCYQKEPTFTGAYESADGAKTNEWLTNCADWLIGEVGATIAGQYIKDPATAAEFKEEAGKARQRLYVAHVAREEMNRERSMGDD